MVSMTVCDLGGEDHRDVPAVTRLDLTLDGERRRLDLCAEHADRARDVLDGIAAMAVNRPGPVGGRVPGSRRDLSADRANVREWATANGYPVSARGRVPAVVLDAHRAAHHGPDLTHG